MGTFFNSFLGKSHNFFNANILIDWATTGKSAQYISFIILKTWKFGDDGFFYEDKFMKVVNLAVQNMVNNVDYFLGYCYSKAFGDFLQKSYQPILLLY